MAFRPAEVGLGADVEHDDLLAVENHLRRDGRRDLGEAAFGARDADGAAAGQGDGGDNEQLAHYSISNSNSARTSPTSVPVTLRSGQSR